MASIFDCSPSDPPLDSLASDTHTEQSHLKRLHELCRTCGRRSLSQKERKRKRRYKKCEDLRNELNSMFHVNVSSDDYSTHSSTICYKCVRKISHEKSGSSTPGVVPTARNLVKSIQHIWTPFNENVSVKDCAMCAHYNLTTEGNKYRTSYIKKCHALHVTLSEKEKEVRMTGKEDEYRITEKEEEASMTGKEVEVKMTGKEEEVRITEKEEEVRITEKEEDMRMTEKEEDVTMTEKEEEVRMTETEKEVRTSRKRKAPNECSSSIKERRLDLDQCDQTSSQSYIPIVGQEFSSYEEMAIFLEQFSLRNNVILVKKSSVTIAAYKRRNVSSNISDKLLYQNIEIACRHNGRYKKTVTTGERPNTKTTKTGCNMIIIARATKSGQALTFTTVRLEHNHPCTEDGHLAQRKKRKHNHMQERSLPHIHSTDTEPARSDEKGRSVVLSQDDSTDDTRTDAQKRNTSTIFTESMSKFMQLLHKELGSVEKCLSLTGTLLLTIDSHETISLSVNEQHSPLGQNSKQSLSYVIQVAECDDMYEETDIKVDQSCCQNVKTDVSDKGVEGDDTDFSINVKSEPSESSSAHPPVDLHSSQNTGFNLLEASDNALSNIHLYSDPADVDISYNGLTHFDNAETLCPQFGLSKEVEKSQQPESEQRHDDDQRKSPDIEKQLNYCQMNPFNLSKQQNLKEERQALDFCINVKIEQPESSTEHHSEEQHRTPNPVLNYSESDSIENETKLRSNPVHVKLSNNIYDI